MSQLEQLFKMKRMLKSKSLALGLSYECVVEIIDYSKAFAQIEDGEEYLYPSTFEIKIESRSNHFYSLRVVDGAWIREGRNLLGPGRTAAQVYRMIVRELKEHANENQLRKAV